MLLSITYMSGGLLWDFSWTLLHPDKDEENLVKTYKK